VDQVQLDIGPSVVNFPREREGKQEACLDGVTTCDQRPRKTDLISHWNRARESGLELGITFPKLVSLNGSQKRGRAYTFPAQTVGLDVERIEMDRWKSNHFYWLYPVACSAEPFKQGPVDRSISFDQHTGSIFYMKENAPSSMDIELTITYRIPGRRVFIHHNSKNYPCRSLRFKLHVKILPNEIAQFIYPRDDRSGIFLNLGTFQFTNDHNGHSVLQIRHDDYETRIPNPHLDHQLTDQSHGTNWSTQKVAAGMYKTKDSDGYEGIASAGGELDLNLRNWS
jgi:hypothetical protein